MVRGGSLSLHLMDTSGVVIIVESLVEGNELDVMDTSGDVIILESLVEDNEISENDGLSVKGFHLVS